MPIRFLLKCTTNNLDEHEIKQLADKEWRRYFPVYVGVNTIKETRIMTADQLDIAYEIAKKKFEYDSLIVQSGVAQALNGDGK